MTWGVWLTGPTGEDYVTTEADSGLRPRMGLGVLGQDPVGLAGNWRDVWAIPLAFVRGFLDALSWNANPGTAIDLLPEWEDALAVPRGDPTRRTVAERQLRVSERLRREIGAPTLLTFALALGRIQQAAGWTDTVLVEDDAAGNIRFYFDTGFLDLVSPMSATYNMRNRYVVESLFLLWRFMPAGIGWSWWAKP